MNARCPVFYGNFTVTRLTGGHLVKCDPEIWELMSSLIKQPHNRIRSGLALQLSIFRRVACPLLTHEMGVKFRHDCPGGLCVCGVLWELQAGVFCQLAESVHCCQEETWLGIRGIN